MIYWQRHYFWKKKTKSIRKKLGCKFIRINTSNAKNGYDLDYKIGNVQAFIGEFKNNKIKVLGEQLIKEKEMREKLQNKLKDENLTSSFTNNFRKIIIKNL